MWRFLNRFETDDYRLFKYNFSFPVYRFWIEIHTKMTMWYGPIWYYQTIWPYDRVHTIWSIWHGPYEMVHMIWPISYEMALIFDQSFNYHILSHITYNFTIKIDEFWIKNFDVLKLWAFNALQEWKMSETKLNCHNLY